MPSYEKFYKRVMEYVCTEAGLERAMTEIVAGEEVSFPSNPPVLIVSSNLTIAHQGRVQRLVSVLSCRCIFCLGCSGCCSCGGSCGKTATSAT